MKISFPIHRSLIVSVDNTVYHGFFEITNITQEDEDTTTTCHWKIAVPDERAGVIHGEDPFQAIVLCLKLFDNLMESAANQGIMISWLEVGASPYLTKEFP